MGLYTDKRKTTTTPDGYELLTHESGPIEYKFNWHMGPFWSVASSTYRRERCAASVSWSLTSG